MVLCAGGARSKGHGPTGIQVALVPLLTKQFVSRKIKIKLYN